MAWLVNELTEAGETVCDPFMGSGTTGVACVRYGRNFVGIEKDPVYFEVARKRLEAEMAQGSLDFGGGAGAPTHNPTLEHPPRFGGGSAPSGCWASESKGK